MKQGVELISKKRQMHIDIKSAYMEQIILLFLKMPDTIYDNLLLLIKNHINNVDGSTLLLQDFIGEFMLPELLSWCTSIGIIEAAEHIFEDAKSNGNIEIDIMRDR